MINPRFVIDHLVSIQLRWRRRRNIRKIFKLISYRHPIQRLDAPTCNLQTPIAALPACVLHGTVSVIETFRPLTHFGGPSAARWGIVYSLLKAGINVTTPEEYENIAFLWNAIPRDYTENCGHIYIVQLRMKNPLRIADPGARHNTETFLDLLPPDVEVKDSEAERIRGSEITDIQKIRIIRKIILRSGHDGFVYMNVREGENQDNYVNIFSWQISWLIH